MLQVDAGDSKMAVDERLLLILRVVRSLVVVA